MELPRLVQPEIECLLVNAPLAQLVESRVVCEAALGRVRAAVEAVVVATGSGNLSASSGAEETPLSPALQNPLELTIEHTLTPLFICIRRNHYSVTAPSNTHNNATLAPVPSTRLEEIALNILDFTVTACGPQVFATRERAFWEILGRCVAVIGTAEGRSNQATSEEAKRSCLRVCNVLLRATSTSPMFWVHQAARSKLGHLISIFLSLVKLEKSRHLKTASLHALQSVHVSCDRNTLACFFPGICSGICKLLTGDLAKLGRSVTVAALEALTSVIKVVFGGGGDPENRAVDKSSESTSLDRLRAIVAASATPQGSGQISVPSSRVSTSRSSLLSIQCSDDWVSETASRTAIMLRSVVSKVLAATSTGTVGLHWEVGWAALNLAHVLVHDCSAKGASSALVPVAIETAVASLHDGTSFNTDSDDDEALATLGNSKVASFARRLVDDICALLPVELWQRMQERFRTVIVSLPRVARSQDESHLVARLNTAAGYAEVLGARLRPLFDEDASAKRLLHAICQCLEMNPIAIVGQQRNKLRVTRISTGQHKRRQPQQQSTTSSYYDIPFYHVRSANSRNALRRLVATIARLADGSALLELLTHPNATDWRAQKYSVQSTYLANALFRNVFTRKSNPSLSHITSSQRKADVFSDIRMFCRRTVESSQWGLATVASGREYGDFDQEGLAKNVFIGVRNSPKMSNAQYNNNAILVALLVQRLGDAAEICQELGLNFRRLLLTVAYPLLEKLGDANPVVSQAAHATLRRVALYCGYGLCTDTIADQEAAAAGAGEHGTYALSHLLRDNLDYLVDAVCARLSLPEQHPGTAAVIRGIFNRNNRTLAEEGEATTALLTEVVSTLLQALDREFQAPTMHGLGSEGTLSGVHTLLEVCREIVVSLRETTAPELNWMGLEDVLVWTQKSKVEKRRHDDGAAGGGIEGGRSDGEKVEHPFLNLAKEMQEWQRQVSDLLGEGDIVSGEPEKSAKERDETKGDEKADGLENGFGESPTEVATHPITSCVKCILLRCSHFLSARSSMRVQICCLETMDWGIRTVSRTEQELLPLVAKVWPAIRAQAKSASVPVAVSALRCVVTISIVCGNFIRSRFGRELWPSLLRLLKIQAIAARRKQKPLVSVVDIQHISTRVEAGRIDGANGNVSELRISRNNTQRDKHFRAVLRALGVFATQGMLEAAHVVEAAQCCCAVMGPAQLMQWFRGNQSGSGKEIHRGGRDHDVLAQASSGEELSLAHTVLDQLMALDEDSTWWCVAMRVGCRIEVPLCGRGLVDAGFVKDAVC